jgi:hypothetical protein
MARKDDMPSSAPLSGRVQLDPHANYFLISPDIPESYAVVEKEVQNKSTYDPNAVKIGTAHPTTGLTSYLKYEETVTDIGNGLFEISTKYAKPPSTWYSFEAMQIPFTKFSGVTVTGSGNVVVRASYKFGWLNLQGIDDVRNFNENNYVTSETKQGSINCVVRVKHEYESSDFTSIKNGTLSPFSIETADYEANLQNGTPGNIDDDLTFTFTTASPSKPIKYESGKYHGNIYFQKTFEIVSTFII